jgi:hypothetical protein
MNPRPVTTIGDAAARILAGTGEGRVFAVFGRSFYVDFGGGLVCVGPPDFGPGPSHLLAAFDDVAAWTDRLEPGDPATSLGGVLAVAGLGLDFSGLVPWRAAPPAPLRPADLATGLDRLAEAVARRRPVGLGVLVGDLCRGARPAATALDPFLAPAAAMIAALGDRIRHAAPEAPFAVPEPTGLVGLGPGLTPSGDDFLAGFLIALRRLGRGDHAEALAASVVPLAARATNAISAAHLAHAAAGEISARLIEVLDRIAAGGDAEALLDRVETIGHTSGWDCLAGMVAAAAAMIGRPVPDARGPETDRTADASPGLLCRPASAALLWPAPAFSFAGSPGSPRRGEQSST